jgi:hypothetical protein
MTPQIRLQANGFWSSPKISHGNPLLVQREGRLPGVPESSASGNPFSFEMQEQATPLRPLTVGISVSRSL